MTPVPSLNLAIVTVSRLPGLAYTVSYSHISVEENSLRGRIQSQTYIQIGTRKQDEQGLRNPYNR